MKTLNKDLAAIQPTLESVQLSQVQLQEVTEQLKQDDSTLMQAYCDYSAENGYDSVYDNDDDSINMMFENTHDALRAAFFGDYNPSHAYFTFNGYGNLQSFEYLDSDNSPIDFSELAQWLIDEDKLSEYDITVTTLDDMLASIEDNIADDSNILYRMCDCLTIEYEDSSDNEGLIKDCMNEVSSYSYNKLKGLMEYLNINYE